MTFRVDDHGASTPPDVIRVLVNDTWGGELHPAQAKLFPWADVRRLDYKALRNPHGHMVLVEFLLALKRAHIEKYGILPNRVEVDMFPFLEMQRKYPDSWFTNIAKKKYHAVINSWGDASRSILDMAFAKSKFAQSDKRKRIEDAVGDTLLFWASGNSDVSERGKPDVQLNLNYTQYLLRRFIESSIIVGSCDQVGLPSTFSSDGWVDVAYRGENILLYNPINRKYQKGQGTSFSNPAASGDCVGRGLFTAEGVRAYFKARATSHPSWDGDKLHPKFGEGVIVFDGEKQVTSDVLAMPLSWHDNKKLTVFNHRRFISGLKLRRVSR